MQKKFINNFYHHIKKIFFFPREKLRFLLFDKRRLVVKFSSKKISQQKKILIDEIQSKNFLLIENFIKKRNRIYLIDLFKYLKRDNCKKVVYIYIYSYLVNLNEYQLANDYQNYLCKKINKNSFFYFQISSLNSKNISEFIKYSKTIKFSIIYNFLLYESEKNFIKTILKVDNQKVNNYNLNFLDINYQKYIQDKEIKIIGPLENNVYIKKKELKKSLIIRFKNNNFLKKKDLQPNIIYLNGTATREAIKKKNYLIKKINLIWIVFIQKNFYQQFSKRNDLNYRFANNCSAFLFNCFTELNLLQKVLLDLFLFNSKKIKIYNFDIRLSKNTKIGYGIYNTKKKQKKIKMSFLHNQIVMYDFLNYFFYKNKITLDKRLAKIIRLGKVNYLNKLEKTWKK